MWYQVLTNVWWICIENALAHQACVLRAELEKSLKDNASLYMKIGTEYSMIFILKSSLSAHQLFSFFLFDFL